ncbi:hypothetical protein ABH945_006028 [Paraburkholderia sp. GAS333]|uniref:hypothetical protein n=1 Tax=Paraburkholderia sp. GAS333 TaxID=3156279 RepID=UPI003D201C56
MDELQKRQQFRKQANDVVRLTLSRIRAEQRRLDSLHLGSDEHLACVESLGALRHSLSSMLMLHKNSEESCISDT